MMAERPVLSAAVVISMRKQPYFHVLQRVGARAGRRGDLFRTTVVVDRWGYVFASYRKETSFSLSTFFPVGVCLQTSLHVSSAVALFVDI